MTVVAGRYDLLTQVALTSSGALWHGRDAQLSRDVALKQTPLSDAVLVQRLRSEARTLAGVEHPNVVAVFGLVEDAQSAWLVEEWVPGVALPALVEQAHSLRPQQALGVVRGALTGLAYTHQRQIVHGSVSAENILLDGDGVSKLVDFGLASPADGADRTPQLDVHGAGTVLASLLTGRNAPGNDLPEVSRSVRPVLARALAPEPQDRYPDAAAFLAALEEAAERDYGAGWLADAGVAGLVAAAVTTAAGRIVSGATPTGATTTGATTTGSSTSSMPAQASAGPAGPHAASPVVARVPTGRQLLRPRYLIPGGAATAVVVVAVILVLVNGNGPASPQNAAGKTSPSTTSTPVATKATSGVAATSVAGTAPIGRYRLAARVTSSNNHFKGNYVGDRATHTWTIAMTCAGQRCTGKATSDSGGVFPLTYNGTTLRSVNNTTKKMTCIWSGGPNKGKPDVGTYNEFADDDTLVFTAVPNPTGGPVRQFRGTEIATGVWSKGRGTCALRPPVRVVYAMTLSLLG